MGNKERVFVDTDVVLDLLTKREPFFQSAILLFNLAEQKEIDAYISPISISNLYYILRKTSGNAAAISAINTLRLILGIAPMDQRMVDIALASGFDDIEDALQYYTAVENNMEVVITRNVKD
jgi:predicted nucleic acid-binding protein